MDKIVYLQDFGSVAFSRSEVILYNPRLYITKKIFIIIAALIILVVLCSKLWFLLSTISISKLMYYDITVLLYILY